MLPYADDGAEEPKGRPCPVCRTKLLPQYREQDNNFQMRHDPTRDVWRVPMRCPKCGINVEVTIDPRQLKEEEPE